MNLAIYYRRVKFGICYMAFSGNLDNIIIVIAKDYSDKPGFFWHTITKDNQNFSHDSDIFYI